MRKVRFVSMQTRVEIAKLDIHQMHSSGKRSRFNLQKLKIAEEEDANERD